MRIKCLRYYLVFNMESGILPELVYEVLIPKKRKQLGKFEAKYVKWISFS